MRSSSSASRFLVPATNSGDAFERNFSFVNFARALTSCASRSFSSLPKRSSSAAVSTMCSKTRLTSYCGFTRTFCFSATEPITKRTSLTFASFSMMIMFCSKALRTSLLLLKISTGAFILVSIFTSARMLRMSEITLCSTTMSRSMPPRCAIARGLSSGAFGYGASAIEPYGDSPAVSCCQISSVMKGMNGASRRSVCSKVMVTKCRAALMMVLS